MDTTFLLRPDVWYALQHALQAAAALFVSHSVAVAILMYLDLSEKWDRYAISTQRSKDRRARFALYWSGWKSFLADIMFLFIPCMGVCIWYKLDAIMNSPDTWYESVLKLVSGYVLGKVWACAVHYALHFPSLYRFHRRHHQKPCNIVASAAWDDSIVEYAVMEIPSFCLTLLAFPTHWVTHLLHFVVHGVDGAAGHSGFKAPGFLGHLFDGEYHYYHHAYLTVNYAEIEILDVLLGTHHSQRANFKRFNDKN